MLIRRLARPMLAASFISGGINTLRNPSARVEQATPLITKAEEALPDDVTANVPTDPDTLVKINAGVHVLGGLLLATGKAPRLASTVLAASLIPTTVAGHPFWEATDPKKKAADQQQFIKNVGLLGGLMLAAVDTEGKPSLGWRGRKAAKAASAAVSTAVPFAAAGASGKGESLAGAASKAAERGQELAHRVAESDTTKRLSASSEQLAQAARVRAAELARLAAERGGELAQVASDRGPVLAEQAKARSAVLAAVAGERGSEWADLARARGAELATVASLRGAELAEQARERGAELAKESAKQRRKAERRWL
ncbi:DoxX family protein [Rhodococcus sp. X156]|uniref:DoxX family protein n=1 Tax=Rhodococcus sp. X156 TaxID=2499145 RepID=UPI000FD7B864|nr:DoxX family protein [Rhodococcus sp. X156]